MENPIPPEPDRLARASRYSGMRPRLSNCRSVAMEAGTNTGAPVRLRRDPRRPHSAATETLGSRSRHASAQQQKRTLRPSASLQRSAASRACSTTSCSLESPCPYLAWRMRFTSYPHQTVRTGRLRSFDDRGAISSPIVNRHPRERSSPFTKTKGHLSRERCPLTRVVRSF
jgi:hypothetical protein